MSKQTNYKPLKEEVPPPYDQAARAGYDQPMTTYPSADPGYAYGPNPTQNVYNPSMSHTNIVQVQPGGPTPTTVIMSTPEPIPSMAGHITLSCFVFWCCSPLFGCIAFFVAISGLSANSAKEARSLGKASLWLNISGIITSVIVAGVLIGLYFSGVLFAEKSFVDQLSDGINNNLNDLNNDANRVFNDVNDVWNKNVASG